MTATPSMLPSHAPVQSQVPHSRADSPTTHNSSLPMRARQVIAQGSMGSQTQTQTNADTSEATGVLRLRGAHEPGPRRVVQWAESVVDNEGLGRKSSKVCCIYHAPKAVGESSSEDDSSSGSDSDGSNSGADDGAARMAGAGGVAGKKRRRRRRRRRAHRHEHGHEHGDDCTKKAAKSPRRPSPNAYERMPKTGQRREVKK